MNDLLSCFDKARSNRNHKISCPKEKEKNFFPFSETCSPRPRTRPTAPCA